MEEAFKSLRDAPSASGSTHKYFPPPEFPGAIRRDALLERLLANPSHRVILIQGPAGHGKSTLLQQLKSTSEAQGITTAWLTLDEADNDPRRLFHHLQGLVGAVRRVAPTVLPPDPEEGAGGPGIWRPVDWFVSALIEAGKPVSLFLDEFQQLSDPTILAFFREVLERIPETVRIFVASRSVPDIGLARLVVNNLAAVIRTDDLRFSFAEVMRFFATVPDLNIRADETEVMYRQTEGWPAALQLFRLSLVSPSVRRTLGELGEFRPPELADYLADNVLGLQAPAIQDFLRRTSLLTRLCAPLCDAVMGRPGSQEILLFLERSGLFVRSLDSERRWFRLHSLFSTFLQEQLRQTAEDAGLDIHRRAMIWYRDHGHFEDAAYHAVAACDYSLAADIMDPWFSRLVADAHLTTVERWAERIPAEEIARRPDLTVKIAWALTFLRRRAKLVPILAALDEQDIGDRGAAVTDPRIVRAMVATLIGDLPGSAETIAPVGVHDVDLQGFRAFELGAAANLKGYLALTAGEFEQAKEFLLIARAYSRRAESSFTLGYAMANTAVTLLMQGRLTESLDCCRLGIDQTGIRMGESFAGAALVACFIQALYEANDIDGAEALFNESREMITQATLLDYLAVTYVTMARIDDLRGRHRHAEALLDEAEVIGLSNALPRLVRIVNLERIRRMLLRGESVQAQSLAARLREAPGVPLPEGWILFAEDSEGDVIGAIRLAIHSGRTEEALREISRQLVIAQRSGRIRRQIKLRVLEAVAYARKDSDPAARRYLRQALQLAQPGGYVRTILDEGPEVTRLLRAENESPIGGHDSETDGAIAAFVAALLAIAGGEQRKASVSDRFEPLEPLTRREIDILVFLANGASNKEIARRTQVSENTVKFHLKNIYAKLAVTSRLQAINAARKMGLL